MIKFRGFFKFKEKFILKFGSFINLPWGHVRSHTKGFESLLHTRIFKSLQPDDVNLCYFKLRLFGLTECLV